MGADQVISELTRKIEFLLKRQAQMEQESQELTLRVQQLETFEEDNKILRHENTELKTAHAEAMAENADKKSKIAELEVRLNSNSRNSSNPPSSDGYKKKPALPKKKKGKQGGQEGHKGRTLQQVEHPDKIVKHKPGPCDCGHEFTDNELVLSETRQVFDFPQPQLEITEHQLLKGQCPDCGKWHKGCPPEGVNAPVQYGNGVKAYAVLLNVHFKLPFKKIQLLFNDLFGYSINESTVYSAAVNAIKNLRRLKR